MIDKQTARHYTWGDRCDSWELLMTAQLSVIHERMPPGTFEARHYHEAANQFFFVLKGPIIFEVAGQRNVLRAHQAIEVPPHSIHQIFNESNEEVEFLLIACPPSRGDRVLAD